MCDVYTVGERCPLGCLAVILVKRATDGHVFAWCSTCGLAWREPVNGTWRPEDWGSTELHAPAITEGATIALATQADVERSFWANLAHPAAAAQNWPLRQIDDFNSKFGCEDGSTPKPSKRMS
jgi:hypothetical protein